MKAAILLALAVTASAGGAAAAEFAIGERLKQTPASKSAPAAKQAPATQAAVREITWDALMPKDWNPAAKFKDLKLDELSDSDPRAMEALAELRAELDRAPVVQEMNGARVKIPGFLVMLDATKEGVTEFLLVPYFGACIHVPPPPSNQVVHVIPAKPVSDKLAMFPVWVTGTIHTKRSDTTFGVASYRIAAAGVEPYPWQEKRGK